MFIRAWDYLILTAANEPQAAMYRDQLAVRAKLGLLGAFEQWLVVADPQGKRVGSGGSTVGCLMEVLNQHDPLQGPNEWLARLSALRILVVHAGGDSRRLPAYGPCGKAFIPLPCDSDSAVGTTLLDYQLPIYAALPAPTPGRGQVVITSGDVLLGFDPREVVWCDAGMTGLGCRAAPERAAQHGVYCVENGGRIRRFLQKPSVDVQHEQGAIDQYGETVLDIGVIDFDADAAVRLLEMCQVGPAVNGRLAMHGEMRDAIMTYGLDFYREICCVLGTDSTLDAYVAAVRSSGSRWPAALLERIDRAVSPVPSAVCVLKKCDFLHFGSTREILASGRRIFQQEQQQRLGHSEVCLSINNHIAPTVALPKAEAWIEGCRLQERVSLSNHCLLVGVDIDQPLELPPHTCLDVLPGRDRQGQPVHFVRCYRDDDPLHNTPAEHVRLCGQPIHGWLANAGIDAHGVWDSTLPMADRNAWNARLFPAERCHENYRRWLWMFCAAEASDQQWSDWAAADRYSFEEMATLADVQTFHTRRIEARAVEIHDNLRRYFRGGSGFSAGDLAYLIQHSGEPETWLTALVAEARRHAENSDRSDPQQAFAFARIVHSCGSALLETTNTTENTEKTETTNTTNDTNKTNNTDEEEIREIRGIFRYGDVISSADREWLEQVGLSIEPDTCVRHWAERAKQLSFERIRGQIISSSVEQLEPRNSLRPDEIVWGRAPARLDLGGGWTDTPPYALEHGGCVLNAAVELNGQPPIQAFARVTRDPLISIRSIDLGTEVELHEWDQLMNCGVASGEFSLVQAALAISGFTPQQGKSLRDVLKKFGGGLGITTLAAIPKGSGLGTSSIMGSVLLAVINRVLGRQLSPKELFHGVLRLEQKLTTGGGWQDQIGGSVGGLKLITTQPGMVPDATIRYVPADVLDPHQNGGQTLLYYTGITRLAKNILQQVVGRYLDRDREAMRVLRGLHDIASQVAEAMARKDIAEFGRLIDQVWQLNKQLDPDSSNAQIEEMLARVRPWIHGAKLLGAGGGGFLLLICKSIDDAGRVRAELDGSPPNDRARFFDFAVSMTGLGLSVC